MSSLTVSGLIDGPDQLDKGGLQSGDDQTSDEEPDISTLRSIAGSRFFYVCRLEYIKQYLLLSVFFSI